MPSANSEIFTSFFPVWIPFILFLLWLLWPKLPKLCWIVVVSAYPCLVPDFRGNAFNFSPLRLFAVGLSYIAFIMLRYVPSIPAFWRFFVCLFVFYHKWMLNFVKGLLCPNRLLSKARMVKGLNIYNPVISLRIHENFWVFTQLLVLGETSVSDQDIL